jgi:hypothetical protein
MYRASWLGTSVTDVEVPPRYIRLAVKHCSTRLNIRSISYQCFFILYNLQFQRFRLYQQRVVCKHVKFPFCRGSVTSSGDNINSLQWAVVTARDARCHDVTMDLDEWYGNAVNSGGCWEPHSTRYESKVSCKRRQHFVRETIWTIRLMNLQAH